MESAQTTQPRIIAGRYELQHVLGRGGMGVVWRAADTLLRRTVAVKEVVIPTQLPENERADIQQRVLREARAAARLNHPGAVSVFDVVQDARQTYVVMEFVEAPTLQQTVGARGPLAPELAAQIGLRVLDVLTAAHANGIVHRDIKPSNVMILSSGQVKLTDFGIASLSEDPTLTASGLALGSPPYMAPEQALGIKTGPPTDLWGLGATLYFAVEGRPPFEKSNPLATLAAIVNEALRSPSAAGPLEPVVVGLLRKDPGERLSGNALVAALTRAASAADGEDAPTQRLAALVTTEFGPSELGEESPERAPATPALVLAEGAAEETSEEAEEAEEAEAEPPDEGAVADVTGRWEGPWSEPEPRAAARRSPIGWIAAATVALVALAGVFLGIALTGHGSPPTGSPSASSSHGSTQGKQQTSPVPASSATLQIQGQALPAHWRAYTDPTTGYRLAYPAGWRVVRRDAATTDFQDPASGSYLRVAWTSSPGSSPEQAWRDYAPKFAATHDNYREIRIESGHFHGFPAAQWEFTYTVGSVQLHAVDLGFVTGAYGFALNFQTHESDWASSQGIFETFQQTFQAPS